MAKNTDRIRQLLEGETFPLRYVHKFIGKNTTEFREAVKALSKQFPAATCEGFRESGETHAYLAYTFVQMAADAGEVVDFLEATALLQDLKLIL